MFSYQITTSIIGLFIGFYIIYLIKHDKLHAKFAVYWFIIAILIVIFGIFPKFVDKIGSLVGVNYPPILLVVISISFILIKLLRLDIENSRKEQKIRELIQKISILERELEEKKKNEETK